MGPCMGSVWLPICEVWAEEQEPLLVYTGASDSPL